MYRYSAYFPQANGTATANGTNKQLPPDLTHKGQLSHDPDIARALSEKRKQIDDEIANFRALKEQEFRDFEKNLLKQRQRQKQKPTTSPAHTGRIRVEGGAVGLLSTVLNQSWHQADDLPSSEKENIKPGGPSTRQKQPALVAKPISNVVPVTVTATGLSPLPSPKSALNSQPAEVLTRLASPWPQQTLQKMELQAKEDLQEQVFILSSSHENHSSKTKSADILTPTYLPLLDTYVPIASSAPASIDRYSKSEPITHTRSPLPSALRTPKGAAARKNKHVTLQLADSVIVEPSSSYEEGPSPVVEADLDFDDNQGESAANGVREAEPERGNGGQEKEQEQIGLRLASSLPSTNEITIRGRHNYDTGIGFFELDEELDSPVYDGKFIDEEEDMADQSLSEQGWDDDEKEPSNVNGTRAIDVDGRLLEKARAIQAHKYAASLPIDITLTQAQWIPSRTPSFQDDPNLKPLKVRARSVGTPNQTTARNRNSTLTQMDFFRDIHVREGEDKLDDRPLDDVEAAGANLARLDRASPRKQEPSKIVSLKLPKRGGSRRLKVEDSQAPLWSLPLSSASSKLGNESNAPQDHYSGSLRPVAEADKREESNEEVEIPATSQVEEVEVCLAEEGSVTVTASEADGRVKLDQSLPPVTNVDESSDIDFDSPIANDTQFNAEVARRLTTTPPSSSPLLPHATGSDDLFAIPTPRLIHSSSRPGRSQANNISQQQQQESNQQTCSEDIPLPPAPQTQTRTTTTLVPLNDTLMPPPRQHQRPSSSSSSPPSPQSHSSTVRSTANTQMSLAPLADVRPASLPHSSQISTQEATQFAFLSSLVPTAPEFSEPSVVNREQITIKEDSNSIGMLLPLSQIPQVKREESQIVDLGHSPIPGFDNETQSNFTQGGHVTAAYIHRQRDLGLLPKWYTPKPYRVPGYTRR
ncbi:hypothetical protein DV738_g1400, partial [Chaetothyriales sp. CBS 135597]